MAIEDGASLGVMLGDGILPEKVPERLQLYNKARYERATNIQQFSLEVGRDAAASKPGETSRFKGKVELQFQKQRIRGNKG